MIIIRLFSNFLDSEKLYKLIMNQYNWSNVDEYNIKYKFTYNEDYTHAIVYTRYNGKINVTKNNVIGLALEPENIINPNKLFKRWAIKNTRKYYIGKLTPYLKSNNNTFVQGWTYLFPQINNNKQNNTFEKNKLINYVYSSKTNNSQSKFYNTVGLIYDYRHELGESIIKNNINVDIWGSCTKKLKNKYQKNINIKDSFKWENCGDAYKDYKFCIVIENSISPDYFSEKIIIPLLHGCIPIYLGCLNINKYLGDCVIQLKGSIKEDIKLIKNIIENPHNYNKLIDKKKILEIIHLKNLIKKEFL